ncbi:MAG: IS630 family transposase [Bacteroidetes bacterium]|nr:IS630 family transposase [Bacteroidota bacterium]
MLTEKERVELRLRHKSLHDSKKKDRIKCILMLDRGYSIREISECLLISDESINNWKKLYQVDGIDALLSDNYKGGTSLLSVAMEQELTGHLEEHLYVHSSDIIQHIEKKYNVRYSTSGVKDLLHRLGFTWKKPKHVPGKADAKRQETFLEQYSEIKAAKQTDDQIYFVDSAHPMHNSQPACGWIRKGKQKTLKANSGRQRLNLNGALRLGDNQVIVQEAEVINSQAMIALFKQIEKKQPEGLIYLVLDNARYNKSKQIKSFQKKHERFQFLYLPPYSPNLNLIERLWRFYRSKILHNRYYEKFNVFRDCTKLFFQNINAFHLEMKSLFTDNFQIIPN